MRLFVHDGIDGLDAGVAEAIFFQCRDTTDGRAGRSADIVLENTRMCAGSQLQFR